MFKGGMQHLMGWPYEDAETLHRGQEGDRVMGREGIRPSLSVSGAKAPVLMGFTTLSHLF